MALGYIEIEEFIVVTAVHVPHVDLFHSRPHGRDTVSAHEYMRSMFS